VLVAIQQEISNEQRYTLLYKFVAKSHIHNMQMWYNEAIAKGNDGSDQQQPEESKVSAGGKKGSHNAAAAQAALAGGKTFGEDGFKYP